MKIQLSATIRFYAAACLAVLILAMPELAQAQQGNVGQIIAKANTEMNFIPQLVASICYVIAIFLILIAIIRIKQHVDAPERYTLSRPMLMLTSAGLLFYVGGIGTYFLANTLQLGFTENLSNLVAGSANGITAVNNDPGAVIQANGVTLDQMLVSFVGNVWDPLVTMANVAAYVLGLILLAQGLLSLSKWGEDPRSHSAKHITTKLVIAGVLMSLPQLLSVTSWSLFGQDTTLQVNTTLAYNPANAQEQTNVNNAVNAALQFIQIIGFIAFVRGWILLRAAVEGIGQASHGTAFTHILGGALAINIVPTIYALQNTFGLDIIT